MMRADADRLTAAQFRVLVAVCKAYATGSPVTVREVARLCGHGEQMGWVHPILLELRALGLATWADGRCSTLRPTCTVEVMR